MIRTTKNIKSNIYNKEIEEKVLKHYKNIEKQSYFTLNNLLDEDIEQSFLYEMNSEVENFLKTSSLKTFIKFYQEKDCKGNNQSLKYFLIDQVLNLLYDLKSIYKDSDKNTYQTKISLNSQKIEEILIKCYENYITSSKTLNIENYSTIIYKKLKQLVSNFIENKDNYIEQMLSNFISNNKSALDIFTKESYNNYSNLEIHVLYDLYAFIIIIYQTYCIKTYYGVVFDKYLNKNNLYDQSKILLPEFIKEKFNNIISIISLFNSKKKLSGFNYSDIVDEISYFFEDIE